MVVHRRNIKKRSFKADRGDQPKQSFSLARQNGPAKGNSDQDNISISSVLGSSLKAARLQKKLELDAVAADLCIRPRYLQALEADCFGVLPNDVCTVGFLRSYAEFLALDADSLIAAYRKHPEHLEHGPTVRSEQPSFLPSIPSSLSVSGTLDSSKASGLLLAIFGIIGIMIIWGLSTDSAIPDISQDIFQDQALISNISSLVDINAFQESGENRAFALHAAGDRMPDTIPGHWNLKQEIQMALDMNRENEARFIANPAVNVTVQVMAAKSLIRKMDIDLSGIISTTNSPVFVATRDVWLSLVTSSGELVWEGILSSGDIYRPVAGEHLQLTTSDAGALTLIQNGQKRSMGQRGLMLKLSDIDLIKAEASTLSDDLRRKTGSIG